MLSSSTLKATVRVRRIDPRESYRSRYLADRHRDVEYRIAQVSDNVLRDHFEFAIPFLRPFTDNQIELVKNFAASSRHCHRERAAAQRASAIARTADGYLGGAVALWASLIQIIGNATQICDAKFGNLRLYTGDIFQLVASDSSSAEVASELLRSSGFVAARAGPNDCGGCTLGRSNNR
jgi:hypothetical protein